MSAYHARESCGRCGATTEFSGKYPSDVKRNVDDFRDAHAICRERTAIYDHGGRIVAVIHSGERNG